MDFSKLMKQAKANQMVAERKHERQKQQKEDQQREVRVREEYERRRTAARLKEFKATTERERLEYKGLLGRGGVAMTTQGRQEPSPSPPPPPQTKPSQPAERDKLPKKKKTEASKTGPSTSKTGQSTSKTGQSTSKTSQSTSSSSDKTRTDKRTERGRSSKPGAPDSAVSKSGPAKPKPKAPAMNFNDLLKIAKDKQTEVGGKDKRSSLLRAPLHGDSVTSGAKHGTSQAKPSCARDGSPLGKSLLERTNPRSKLKRTPEPVERRPDTTSASQAIQRPASSSESAAAKRKQPDTRTSSSITTPSQGPNARRDPVHVSTTREHHTPSSNSTQNTSTILPRPKLKRPPAQPRTKPVRAKSFYGDVPPSARLIKDGGPRNGRGLGLMPYTSTWVHEMSDFVSQRREEGYSDEEEEDDDLADFVASDDEEGMEDGEEDYSSEIRKIFGYDRRKYADERFDGSAMESSYAQQMYEEQRSARIGRQEDDEDLQRERELAKRKKRKMDAGTGQKPPASKRQLVQSKLKFK